MKPEPKANCSTGILHVKPTVLSGTLRKYNQLFRSFCMSRPLKAVYLIFPQFTSSSFYVSFLNSTNSVCSQCMGLAWRPWVRILMKSRNVFGLIYNCLNCNYHCDDHIFIYICIFPQSTSSSVYDLSNVG